MSLASGGGDVGSVRYTRSDCSFGLLLLANNPPHFEFQERLKNPLKVLKCGAGAKLLFDLTSDTTIKATAVNPNTGMVLGTGSLVAATAAPPAAATGACAVEVVRTHLSIKDASCEQIWRYHVMRKFLIPYVTRQRAFIDAQEAGFAKVQADAKAVADVADLAFGFVNTYEAVFAVPRPQDVKLLETVVAADDIVETVYGIPDSNNCGPGVVEYIKIGVKAVLVPPKAVEVIPTMSLKSGGCVVALLGEKALVLPARNLTGADSGYRDGLLQGGRRLHARGRCLGGQGDFAGVACEGKSGRVQIQDDGIQPADNEPGRHASHRRDRQGRGAMCERRPVRASLKDGWCRTASTLVSLTAAASSFPRILRARGRKRQGRLPLRQEGRPASLPRVGGCETQLVLRRQSAGDRRR